MSGPLNNNHQEENAKAEQIGAGIGCLWFIALFVCIPLIIVWPPSFFLMVGAAVWIVYRMQQTKSNR